MTQPLWQHQQQEIDQHTFEPGRFLYWDPRTGKTRPIVLEIAQWVAAGITHVLIVAPVDGCKVWLKADELGRFDPAKVRIVDLAGDLSIADRAKLLRSLVSETRPTIVVVNRDVIFRERAVKRGENILRRPGLLKALLQWDVQALVLDECQDYRKVSSARHRAAEALGKRARFRRGLSGTPDPRDAIDYYGQFKIIAPEVFGTRKIDFQTRYCVMHPIFPNKVEYYINQDELRAKILSVSTIVKQADCYDMPQILPDLYIDVPLTKLARELYDELTKNFVADFLGLQLDATHQLARLAMLHQLAQGFLRGEDEPEWVFDGKIAAALRYVAEMMAAGKRVVVYHHYKPEGERLYAALVKLYGTSVVGNLNGTTPRSQRSAHPFRDRPGMQLFIAQEDTAQVAISLKESDHVLWYSWGPKSDVNKQCRDRIFADRSEKPHGLSYTFLRVPRTIDDFMTATYKAKQSRSEMLLQWGPQWAAEGVVL